MQERRGPDKGDITGQRRGDFTDWDNPEDEYDDGAPDGYYDDEDDDSYIPDENDPDYDLSEAHGYSEWEPRREGSPFPSWLVAAASILLIIAILIPLLLRIR